MQCLLLTEIREPLIKKILETLDLKQDSHGIDIGCGIGRITNFISKHLNHNSTIIGLDFSEDLVSYAQSKTKQDTIQFMQGDNNNLQFDENSFDWIWTMDTVWPGPTEYGCPAEGPDDIIKQLYHILKPGGKLYMSYWTSQKFLQGYPLLEAKLNASESANAPFRKSMKPYTHVLNARKWLHKGGFNTVHGSTYVHDINGPLDDAEKTALSIFFQMFWENASDSVSKTEWKLYNELSSQNSDKFILNDPEYYAFFGYTLFQGVKV